MHQRDPWFDPIYERNSKRLLKTARQSLGDRGIAEELVQETFILLLIKRSKVEKHENIDKYLMRVLINKIRSELQKAEYKRVDQLEEKHTPFLAVEDKEKDFMADILPDWLSERDRQFIIWRVEEERSMREVAVLMGCSEEACHARMYRLRNRFKKTYGNRK